MASFSLDMVLPALMLVALFPLSAAKMIFIPGTGCGTFSPIKIHDNVAENATMEDLACSFVKDEVHFFTESLIRNNYYKNIFRTLLQL